MATIPQLTYLFMTGIVNEIRSPNVFLKDLLWGPSTEETLPVEEIELDTVSAGREIAPFVRKNGQGVMVAGVGATYQTVAGPNIRLKRPFTPSDLLFGRKPGVVTYVQSSGQVTDAAAAHISRDLQKLNNMIVNAEEYLCSQALQGVISYSVADQESIQITFPRSGGNVITLTTNFFWNDGTTPNVQNDFYNAKQIVSELGLPITDAIMGSEAALAFRNLIQAGTIKNFSALMPVQAGNIDFTRQFTDAGALYMGNLGGVDCWEYRRTATLNGTAVDMIRKKYVEFVCRTPGADRKMYYAAIPDMDAFQGGLFQAKRFSKSWLEKDPSALIALEHSRPLPVPRRPDASVSMKVVSG